MAKYAKRWPIWRNNRSLVNFQYFTYAARPWAMPAVWEWVWVTRDREIPGADWRGRGWIQPLVWFGGTSTFTPLFLTEDRSTRWFCVWDALKPVGQDVETRCHFVGTFPSQTLGDIDPYITTDRVGRTTTPRFAIPFFFYLVWKRGTEIQRTHTYELIPHDDCWEPDFDQ